MRGTDRTRRPRRQLARLGPHLPLRLRRPLLRPTSWWRPERASTSWSELSGRQLITPSGALDFGPVRDPRALAAILAAVGVEHELLSADRRPGALAADRRRQRGPVAPGRRGDRRREHGARAARAGRTPRRPGPDRLAGRRGRRRRPPGTGWTRGDGRTLDAERVVVTAGGWLPALLDRLPLPAGFRALAPAAAGHPGERLPLPLPGRSETNGVADVHPQELAAIQTYGLPGGRDAGFRGQKIAEFLGGRRIASRGRPGRASSTRRTGPGSSTTSGGTCPAWSPSRTPRRPACSPAPRTRTSSSTASTASRWSPPAPDTAPSSPR